MSVLSVIKTEGFSGTMITLPAFTDKDGIIIPVMSSNMTAGIRTEYWLLSWTW